MARDGQTGSGRDRRRRREKQREPAWPAVWCHGNPAKLLIVHVIF